jgi:phosphoribosylformylglycinamidine synthase subunit PurS
VSVWLAKIQVTLKPVVNDPAGLSVGQALQQLGFDGVSSVRVGKYFVVELSADSKERATEATEAICRRLLANPVIEEYHFTVARRAGRART